MTLPFHSPPLRRRRQAARQKQNRQNRQNPARTELLRVPRPRATPVGGHPCRRSAIAVLGASDATARTSDASEEPRDDNDHGHHASHHASRRNPNGATSSLGAGAPPRSRGPGVQAGARGAWRAAGGRSCPRECSVSKWSPNYNQHLFCRARVARATRGTDAVDSILSHPGTGS